MAPLVLTALFDCHDALVATARDHVLVYSKSDGRLLRSATLGTPVRAAAIDPAGQHLVVVDDAKILHVLKIDTLDALSKRTVAKKSILALVSHDSSTILLVDKFADVYSYPMFPSDEQLAATDSESDAAPGTLILGHVSILTAFTLSSDSKYIITADRDEHIRISNYPLGYVIHSFCMGSTKYVTAIHLLPHRPAVLVSGGGENLLRLWNWKDGKLLHTIEFGDVIQSHIAVLPPDLKKTRQPANKKRKTEVDDEDGQPEKVLAISRIESVDDTLLFSALGATALFFARLHSDGNPVDGVHALDLGSPVLDFALDARDSGKIWVSLDAAEGQPLVKSVRLDKSSGTLTLESSLELSSVPKGDRDPDIYLPLALLPKSPDDEGWVAMEKAGEANNDKQRGRRKVKDQLKALKGTS